MKKMTFLICCSLFLSQHGFSQKNPPVPDSVSVTDGENDKIILKVEEDAKFPGGVSEWRKYLEKHLNAAIPIINRAPKGTYKVIIKFIVGSNGKVSEITPETTQGYGMEQEVIRIIKGGPNWIPAIQNGRMVSAYRRQPVTFVVN